MKRKLLDLAAILGLVFSILVFTGGVLAQQAQSESKAFTPGVVSYQGYVTLDGNPYNGAGYFKFAVVDAAGSASLWSNDGSSTSGDEPTTAVLLTVTNGLFSVLLGDTSLAGMTNPLGPSTFSAPDTFLRVWFSPSGAAGSFSHLVPDRRIASVPYALVAETAGDADTLNGLDAAAFAPSIHDHDTAYVNDDLFEVGNADIATGTLSPDRILGSAWTADNDGPDSGLDADLLDGQHATYFQLRASGTCAVGSTVRLINADGTVVCESHDTRPGFALTTLDSVGNVDGNTSITIGADGLGLISYFDWTGGDLKVAHCNDMACTSATTTTLDRDGAVGWTPSVTIGADGLGLISYYDNNNQDLKVAHCNDTACTSATTATLDSAGFVGNYTSITIGTDGLGLISYFDFSNFDLKAAHCNDLACSSATTATLDNTGIVGYDTSIIIGADGLGLISYYDYTNGDLKVAHCNDLACSSATPYTLDSDGDVGLYTSITIGADGLGLISYYDVTNTNLKVAHCSDMACTSATPYTLDSNGDVGKFTSITLGADGLGLISYYDYTNSNLKVAHCNDTACSSATPYTLDSAGDVGLFTSITIGADGLGLISYHDSTNGHLKVAHLSNALGTPWTRRR